MDDEAAVQELTEVLDLLDRYDGTGTGRDGFGRIVSGDSSAERAVREEILGRIDGIKRIVGEAQPELLQYSFHTQQLQSGRVHWDNVRETVTQVRGTIANRTKYDAIMGPAGPKLAGSELHSWVWGAAASLWGNGHPREAVQTAALSVELELRKKLGTNDGEGSQLVNAFRPDWKHQSLPRLRLPGFEPGTKDFTSAHNGAASYGVGCFTAIRNIATHRPLVEHALEMLAALSLLARWIDEAEVVAAELADR